MEQCGHHSAAADIDAAIKQLKGKSRTARKRLTESTGWGRWSVAEMLYEEYGFDYVADCIPDMMHCLMGLIKDLSRATVTMFEKHNDELWLDSILHKFKAMMPSVFVRGRRFPYGMSHAAIKSWSAEECLLFLRVTWRMLFQV